MKKKIKNTLVYCILFLTYSFLAFSYQDNYLSESDVFQMISQLITYHVDVLEITEDILVKSINNYIHHFDPNKMYLLNEEISEFTNPSQTYRKQLLTSYQNHDLSEYMRIHKIIQTSIIRARSLRNEITINTAEIFEKAKNYQKTYTLNEGHDYANNISEIKEKQQTFLALLLANHLNSNPQTQYSGKEHLLIKLGEKYLVNLENDYLGIDEEEKETSYNTQQHLIFTKIIKSVASSLDAHTAYYSPEEAHSIKIQLEKGMCGIGIVLGEDINGIIIKEVLENSPAFKSEKINEGDVIKKINGKSIEQTSFKKVLELLKGKEGSIVTLELETKEQNIKQVSLVRSKISISDKRVDVNYENFEQGVIGKITLHSFYEGNDNISSETDIKDAINGLRNKNLLGLILDLRENNGGFLSQAIKVSGLFMSNGIVVIAKYSDSNLKYYRTFNNNKFYNGPLIILVSKCSASAAEIVAQALQDYGIAIVVGDEHTYGKGTIQHQTITGKEHGKESLFKVTVGRYYTVSGRSTQISGVKSNILVPSKYHASAIGERYLTSPLPEDSISEHYSDALNDLEPFAKKWFQKYYLPELQTQENQWVRLLPQLRENSQKRIKSNARYQKLLNVSQEHKNSDNNQDLQMEESVNIMKDLLKQQSEDCTITIN